MWFSGKHLSLPHHNPIKLNKKRAFGKQPQRLDLSLTGGPGGVWYNAYSVMCTQGMQDTVAKGI